LIKAVKLSKSEFYSFGIITYIGVAKQYRYEGTKFKTNFDIRREQSLDGQINMFTNEACVYSCIMTYNFEQSDDDVVFFYNQRGKGKMKFDVMKNDFGWGQMPFSKLVQNFIFSPTCSKIFWYLGNSTFFLVFMTQC
jgi:hypothetical protein